MQRYNKFLIYANFYERTTAKFYTFQKLVHKFLKIVHLYGCRRNRPGEPQRVNHPGAQMVNSEPVTESRSPGELAHIYAHTLKRKKAHKNTFFCALNLHMSKKSSNFAPENEKNALPKIWRLAGASFSKRGGRPLYVVSMSKIDRPKEGQNRFRVQRYYKILIYANLSAIFSNFFAFFYIFLHFFTFFAFF